jgi:acyl-CoA synthetase (AMP-forming)/AMP-acid ligase II
MPEEPRRFFSRTPWPDIDIPDVSLPTYVLARAAERGDRPALIDGLTGRTLTYGDVDEEVRRAATGLAGRGFGKGSVLGLYSPNLPEFAVAFLATAMIGGTVTTANPLLTVRELVTQLADARATVLITVPALLDKARQAADQSGIRDLLVFGEAVGVTPFAELLGVGEAPPAVDIDPAEDVVALPYSSGTTGLCKGVMLTHRNLVANCLQTDGPQPLGEGEVTIGVLPFFHIYALTVVLNRGLANGATIVTMPRFEMESFLELIQRHRATQLYLAPPVILGLANSPLVDRFDVSSVRSIMVGAAPLDAALAQRCGERIGCEVMQGYGLTETSPVTHLTPRGRNKPGSIGPPVANTEAIVVDLASGNPLGPGEPGEIWVRGPQVMKGYLGKTAATADAFARDGWLRTGDIAFADGDGYFTIVDRVKELIKYKGFQVPPAELEGVLVSHPSVADAAVIGVPDQEAGEVPKAYVVLKGEAKADELIAYVAERVAPYKKIRFVEVIDQIPKSASGKILRRVLMEQERARASQS